MEAIRTTSAWKATFLSRTGAWAFVLLLAIVVPPFVGGYLTSVLILIAVWGILCVGINLIYGYTGQLSLGHAAFFGIGAYAFGLMTTKVQMGFWPALLAAIVITGILGFLIGIPALRLRGPHFILVTLGFGVIVSVILVAWVELTGGANGLGGIPKPTAIPLPWGKLSFDSLLPMYYFILFFLVGTMAFSHRLVQSMVGRTFVAISHNENLTESLGVNTMGRKLLSFTISAMIGGLAGALYASYNVVISPDIAVLGKSMDVVANLIIGGAGSLAGPIIGTLVLMAVPELLQIVPSLKTLINGIILMLFLLFLPGGIVGGVRSLRSKMIHGKER
jgi:branched-chain amino acid transport system permease protein